MEKIYTGDKKIKMFYVFFISISLLIAILSIFLYLIITNKKISLKILVGVFSILIVTLSLIAFCIEPKVTNDLFRHFRDIDLMRRKGFESVETYNSLIIIKILFYLITFLPNNHFLPAIATIITYSVLMYIICDFYKRKEPNSRVIAIAILFNFALCSFYSTVSGIRNAMACSFLGLGLYLDLIRKEKMVKKIWPYIIAMLIHPISYIVVGVRILFQIKWMEKLKYLILLFSLLYRPLINIFKFINIETTNFLAQKMELYLVTESIEDIRWLIVILTFLAVIYAITILLKRKNKNKNIEFKEYLNFIQLYILLIIACSFVAEIFIKRLTFLFAFFIVPLISLIEKYFDKKQKIIIYGILIFFLCGLIPYSIVELKNTSFVFLK